MPKPIPPYKPTARNFAVQGAGAEPLMDKMLEENYAAFIALPSKALADLASGGAVEDCTDPIFKVHVDRPLSEVYLDALPMELRQRANCQTCLSFFNRFGALVTIDAVGETIPLLWSGYTADLGIYRPVVEALYAAVKGRRISTRFFSREPMWGSKEQGGWTHIHAKPVHVFEDLLKEPHQASAEHALEYKTLMLFLADDGLTKHLKEAVTILRGDQIPESQRFLPWAEWLLGLHTKQVRRNSNLLHRAVAQAPKGWAKPRASMIGNLLEELGEFDLDTVISHFKTRTNGTVYQRPVAPATSGNIKRGEAIIAAMGAELSLQRRPATIDDMRLFWAPAAKKAETARSTGGVFSALMPKAENNGTKKVSKDIVETSKVTMSWAKFRRVYLDADHVVSMKFVAEYRNYGFLGFATAVHPEAPPIVQWDLPEDRNPVTWYTYDGGSSPAQWGVKTDRFKPTKTRVIGICDLPVAWTLGTESHHGNNIVFLLEDCVDVDLENIGLTLFPVALKSEFHEIRATIEAHSKMTNLVVGDLKPVAGVTITGNPTFSVRLDDDTRMLVTIDRLE